MAGTKNNKAMTMKRKIKGGLYLVVDPSIPDVLNKVDLALQGGVNVLQVWNRRDPYLNQASFINTLCSVAEPYGVPVLVHNDLNLLELTDAQGIHFDELPDDVLAIRRLVGRPAVIGVTCGNDKQMIARAIDAPVDYLSFCSMFPSGSAETCEIVMPQIVRQTRQYTSLPIFLAGGVTIENTNSLMTLGADGVAVISGILKSEDPLATAQKFRSQVDLFRKQFVR
jgi:thiamine-phosphate pyrophosphorylase